jgi:hypothetical protein
LSSSFVFNQMGPIDEAAIDRLALVTEVRLCVSFFLHAMTPHVHGGGGMHGSAALRLFACM